MDIVEGEAGSGNEARVVGDVGGTKQVRFKVEDDISEAKTFPEIQTEQEVRVT
jgi:membrane protein implicated in regulation of membrane protease activity